MHEAHHLTTVKQGLIGSKESLEIEIREPPAFISSENQRIAAANTHGPKPYRDLKRLHRTLTGASTLIKRKNGL